MELLTVIILRSVERLIGVLIGGFLAWLGYRLFIDVTAKADSSGNFKLPGGTAIHLTRVGPGIFFSLFGTGIVLISFLKPIDFKQEVSLKNLASAPSTSVKTSYSAAAPPAAAPAASKQALRNLRRPDVALLNRLPSSLKSDLNASERASIVVAIPQIKLDIMETVWASDWGDFTRFKEWVNSGESVPPSELKTAAEFFTSL